MAFAAKTWIMAKANRMAVVMIFSFMDIFGDVELWLRE
jgi:hypothetical protein